MLRTTVLISCLLLATVGVALAEPVSVSNTAVPSGGVTTANLTELWRAGGDDDEVFFGSIAAVKTDAEGNTLLLDSQLSEVHRFAPDGEHLGVIGKEGDGPGEVRRPNDMFIQTDGTICLLQGFPGRVVRLHPDGTPAGDATFSRSASDQGQFSVLIRGLNHKQGMILGGISMSFGGGSRSTQDYFLAQCDNDGLQQQSLLNKEHIIDYAAFDLDELKMDFVWSRIALGPEGEVIVAPDRDALRFEVHTSEGVLERVFSREYDVGSRTDDQSKLARQIIEAVAANYPTQPQNITIEGTQPAVVGMWSTSDGRLWVQTGNPKSQLPDGTWALLDVYDREGNFTQQVALAGDHDHLKDGIFIQPDGRCVVVVGALDAFLNQQAVSSESDEDEESVPLEVICYQMD